MLGRKSSSEPDDMTSSMTPHFDTETGPACVCGATSWHYSFLQYGAAVCNACGNTEGPLRFRFGQEAPMPPKPGTAEEATTLHLAFRSETVSP